MEGWIRSHCHLPQAPHAHLHTHTHTHTHAHAHTHTHTHTHAHTQYMQNDVPPPYRYCKLLMNCHCRTLEVINEVTISVNLIPLSYSITHTMYHIKLHKHSSAQHSTKLHNKLPSPSNSIKSLQLLLQLNSIQTQCKLPHRDYPGKIQ